MSSKPYLFPFGPFPLTGLVAFSFSEPPLGLLVVREGEETVARWGEDWDSLYGETEEFLGTTEWSTLERMAEVCEATKGKGAAPTREQLQSLSLTVADLADNDGFGELKDPKLAFELLFRLGRVFKTRADMLRNGVVVPISMKLQEPEGVSHFGAFVSAGNDPNAPGEEPNSMVAILTQNLAMLKALLSPEGGDLNATGLPFVMVSATATDSWVAQATLDLFGVSFEPKIRERDVNGRTWPVSKDGAKLMALLLEDADAMAIGNTATEWKFETESGPAKLTLSRAEL